MDNHIIGTTHQSLGLAVLIPVIENQVKLLIRSCHQVGSHIYGPEQRAVHLIALMTVEVGFVG